jgi:hypothetical protein
MLTIPETDLVVHPQCCSGNVFGSTQGSKEPQDRRKFTVATKVAKLSTRSGLGPENIIAACRAKVSFKPIPWNHEAQSASADESFLNTA